MRIPTSAIVMTVVLAVPVALALRETTNGSDHAFTSHRAQAIAARDEELAREELARHEAEEAKHQAEEARRELARGMLANVAGARPAQLGSLFDGVVLGAPADSYAPDSARAALEAAERDGDVRVDFDVDKVKLSAIVVTLVGVERRECLDKLEARWGEPPVNSAWRDERSHQRAVLVGTVDCAIRFDRFDTPKAWVDKLPLAAIGSPVKKVAIDPSALVGEDEIDWHAPGVGAGSTPTRITMSIANGKIEAIHLAAETDLETIEAVRSAISARLGMQPSPRTSYRDEAYEWKSRPRVELFSDGEEIVLDISARGAP